MFQVAMTPLAHYRHEEKVAVVEQKVAVRAFPDVVSIDHQRHSLVVQQALRTIAVIHVVEHIFSLYSMTHIFLIGN